MIKIKSIQIEEIRGVRNLTLDFNEKNFVVSGPNGSGKSGVVDAIQFALTGEIGRLKGTGTGDLSLSEHGPHVDKRDYPDDSFVHLEASIPHLNKSASIRRKIKQPKKAVITPNEAEVKEVFATVASHPEIILSRREIIKFILAEAGQRSRDIQALLQLDIIDSTRKTLKTTENNLNSALTAAKSSIETSKNALKRHLDLAELKSDQLLANVNRRRKTLGLLEISKLEKETVVSEGIEANEKEKATGVTKETAVKDVQALINAVEALSDATFTEAATAILSNIKLTEETPDLLSSIKRRPFYQAGLDQIIADLCPLCDTSWGAEELRVLVRDKLKKTEDAQTVQKALTDNARVLSNEATRLRGTFDAILKLPEADKALTKLLSEWSGDLAEFSRCLSTTEGVIAAKERLKQDWCSIPNGIKKSLESLAVEIKKRPDASTAGQARDYLVIAQERLGKWQADRRKGESAAAHAKLGRFAYKAYCEVSESALTELYQDVEGDFGQYYKLINHDDEQDFKAKFSPADGKLDLSVDFHKKGLFPPSAYHSEGHQDGMGVCLYLALMKHVLGSNFTLAVLDDVVMSVDSQHRKQFCKLLKSEFPDTQFVITTHDQVWAKQMRSAGAVGPRNSVVFHTWSVDTGPVLDEVAEVWDQIAGDLARNEVPVAAARLRRHLEYVAGDLADELGAPVSFRGDASYDMGELLGAVVGRQGTLLKSALKSAKSWGNSEAEANAQSMINERSKLVAEKDTEQWIVNKAVHYNEWANLSKEDFAPVVEAFQRLLDQFRCSEPACDSWMSPNSRINPTDLRCRCGSLSFNLVCN